MMAAGGPGRALSDPGGRMWPSADQVSQTPTITSGTLSHDRSERPLISAATPAASARGHRKEFGDGRSTAGSARNGDMVSAIATMVRGMIEMKAHRHPSVLAIRAPYDGPSRPGTIQAPAS